MTSRLLLRPVISYRHVVFPDLADRARRAVNFTPSNRPQPPDDEPAPDLLADDDYDCVCWLFHRAGLNAADYRCETIKRRVPACLRALRVESLAAVRAAVHRSPELLHVAINALVIGVTGFFRDPPVFDVLRDMVLPELLARPSGPRVWSAGCSDGAELYSIAILLAERGAVHCAELLGTDCRTEALARARVGAYDPAAVRNVSPLLLGRYFTCEGPDWRLHPYLRATAQWRCGNVMTTPEPGAWDLLLCRNMAIYLHAAAATRMWRALQDCLRPGGYLVLGKAERPLGATGLRAVAPCVYRRDRS